MDMQANKTLEPLTRTSALGWPRVFGFTCVFGPRGSHLRSCGATTGQGALDRWVTRLHAMKDHRFASSFTPANKAHARILFWLGIVMAALCIVAIGVAEAFMRDTGGGQKGIIVFYRVFGALLVLESVLAGWAYGHVKRMAMEEHL